MNPRECDHEGVIRVLRYLRYTYDLGLFYCPNKQSSIIVFDGASEDRNIRKEGKDIPMMSRMTGEPISINEENLPYVYADASYAGEVQRKSRSGYMIYAFGCLINWFSKKQPTTALSSTEAEFICLTEAVKESIWMRMILGELNLNVDNPMKIYQDNQSTMAIAIDPIHHARVKHMDIKMFFIREHLEKNEVKLVYCPTELMLADILTKALPAPQHEKLVEMMGMRSRSKLFEEDKPQANFVVDYKC
jgi:hypothetical protein